MSDIHLRKLGLPSLPTDFGKFGSYQTFLTYTTKPKDLPSIIVIQAIFGVGVLSSFG